MINQHMLPGIGKYQRLPVSDCIIKKISTRVPVFLIAIQV